MAEYIEREALIAEIQKNINTYWNEESGGYYLAEDALNYSVKTAPTVDVVPKSEYDAVVSAVDNSTKEFLKLHDDYQEAKREVENLKVLLEMTEKAHEGLKELYRTDTDALVEARRKTEVEVAREIFEEIDKALEDAEFEWGTLYGVKLYLAELKKKYTEVE